MKALFLSVALVFVMSSLSARPGPSPGPTVGGHHQKINIQTGHGGSHRVPNA